MPLVQSKIIKVFVSAKERIKAIVNNGVLKRFNLKLYSTKAFGREITLDIARLISQPKIMFDVGANTGQTVDLWTRDFKSAEIHSFEPVERLFKTLKDNVGEKAICNHLGVGSENALMTIHYGVHDVSHSFLYEDVGKGGEETQVVTLDSYCNQHNIGHIDVLKIDVEGFEHQVIDGAEKMLKNSRIDILEVELGFDPKGYYTYYSDFADKLAALGYRTLGFYDQSTQWDQRAELLFCNVLFARQGLLFKN